MKNINRRSMARMQSRKVPGSAPTIGMSKLQLFTEQLLVRKA